MAQKFRIKFRDTEKRVSDEMGFYLFGLFEREQIPGRWLKTDREGTHRLFAAVREKMDIEDWKLIGAVLPLEPAAFYVECLMQHFHREHQVEEVNEFCPAGQRTYGIRIGHAFLITSHPLPAQAVQEPAGV